MSVVKSGYLRKHSKSILHGGWNRVWVILYKDSNLVVYKKQGDSSPMGTINIFEVKKWFAYGEHTNGMPDRPQPPAGCSINQIIGIPEKPSSKAKIHWFLADNEADVHAWMEAICSTLPPHQRSMRHQGHHHQQHHQRRSRRNIHILWPRVPLPTQGSSRCRPPMPSPTYQPHTGYPQQGGYPQAPPPQPYYQPPPAAYPQQPHGAYPQQPHGYYPAATQYGPPPGSYPQQPYYAPPPGGYYPGYQGYHQQQPTVVYQQQPKKKGGFLNSTGGKIAMGAALGYGASRMMGGGMGMFGWGRGSWSSLSSFGSCGSFGSFGSFD